MRSILPKAVQELAQELTKLPGIGPKTARRLSIHLLRQPAPIVKQLASTLDTLHANVKVCSRCFSLSEKELCAVCLDTNRDQKIICVVEDPLSLEAIEQTESYQGMYHVLGGVLSPLEGIGSAQLTLAQLFERLAAEKIEELIIALGHNMEGEATTRHIISHLQHTDIQITRLARGLPTGGDIEFADALTLSAAFAGRRPLSG